MSYKTGFYGLSDQVRKDPEYAWTVQCNLAVPIQDELRCTHEQANRAAARIMSQWFKVDMTQHENWRRFELDWMADKAVEVTADEFAAETKGESNDG